LILYKRLSGAGSQADIDDFQVELINRFGLLPEQAKTLVAQTEFKLRCDALGISKLDASVGGGRLRFDASPHFDPMKLILMVQKSPQVYSFEGQTVFRFAADLEERESRIQFVSTLLNTLESAS